MNARGWLRRAASSVEKLRAPTGSGVSAGQGCVVVQATTIRVSVLPIV
jgi:hypothetical protein